MDPVWIDRNQQTGEDAIGEKQKEQVKGGRKDDQFSDQDHA
jgi:hypothetical protein